MQTYLLSIQGKLALPTLEASRTIHNETAGAPPSVAAAKSLGDLSHMVYVPFFPGQADGFLIMDVWNNMDGLNQFFANPHVQEQAGQIFAQRDPVVWKPAEGFSSYHIPAPYGCNDRIVATVRGKFNTLEDGMRAHNAITEKMVNRARSHGNLSHDAYLRLAPPGSPEALEFFAVDVWMDGAGMGEHYQDPEFLSGFDGLFTAEAATGVWTHPAGTWVEW